MASLLKVQEIATKEKEKRALQLEKSLFLPHGKITSSYILFPIFYNYSLKFSDKYINKGQIKMLVGMGWVESKNFADDSMQKHKISSK